MSDKNYVAICSCGKALEICRDNFPEELKHEAQVMGKWVKRKPLPDGSLELTSEELIEFCKKHKYSFEDRYYKLKRVELGKDYSLVLRYENNAGYGNWVKITNYKAILYLANLFDLTGGEQ